VKNIVTKADFDAEISAGGGRLLLFYSGWCPFCTDFIPVFEKTACSDPAALAKVCVDDLPGLEDSFAVEVVPTVLFFKNGKLAKRLDGALGRGLTAEKLQAFAGACGIKSAASRETI